MHAQILLAVAGLSSAVMAATASTATDSYQDECTSTAEALMTSAPLPPDDLMEYWQSMYLSMAQAMTTEAADDESGFNDDYYGAINSFYCEVTKDLPESLATDYTSYTSSVSSWFDANSAHLFSMATACFGYKSADAALALSLDLEGFGPGYCGLASQVAADSTATATAAEGTVTSASTKATASSLAAETQAFQSTASVSSSTASSASSSVSQAAAPGETAFVAGAIAAAGFLGAAVML